MREPNRPRKPRKLAAPSENKDFGGELSPIEERPTTPDYVPTAQDHVPTAAMSAEDWPTENENFNSRSDFGLADDASSNEVAGDDVAKASLAERWNVVWAQLVDRLSRAERPDDGTIMLSERRKERRAELRKIRWKKNAAVIGVVTAVLVLLWVLFFSPVFRYAYAPGQVTGVAADSIVDANKVALILKSHDGEQLLTMNRGDLENEIVKKVPEVARAEVSVKLPRGLTAHVTAHRPVACIDSGKTCKGVAKDGTLLTLPAEELKSLTRIGKLPEKMKSAKAVSIVSGILGVLDEKTLAQVVKVDFANSGLITLTLTNSRTVNWGTNSDNELKGKVLGVLAKEKVTRIDVSIPLSPTTK